MLSKKENRASFILFNVISTLYMIPVDIDLGEGTMKKKPRLKIRIWWLVFLISNMYWLYVAWRFVQSILLVDHFIIHHFTLHEMCTLALFLANFSVYILFVQNSDSNMAVFNNLFSENDDDDADEGADEIVINVNKVDNDNEEEEPNLTPKQTNLGHPVHRPWIEYSRQEKLTMAMPILTILVTLVMCLVLSQDDTRPQLLYSSLPIKWQNNLAFYTLLIVEGFMVTYMATSLNYLLLVHLLFFAHCEAECDKIDRRLIKASTEKLVQWPLFKKNVQDLRELVILLRLFNNCHAYGIFGFKLLCIMLSLSCSFFAIRHFHSNYLLGMLNLLVAFDSTVCFSIIYEKAFSIPGKLEENQHQILLTSRRLGVFSNTQKELLKKIIKSIPNVGIEVGDFHTLERPSTPTFIGFCVQQISSLLITFP